MSRLDADDWTVSEEDSPPLLSELTVEPQFEGCRLDAFLAHHLSRYSRVHLRRLVTAGGVTVDGGTAKPAYRLHGGQHVSVSLPDLPREGPQPENIPLDILYEDDHLVVINKPPQMVVHPSKGHWSGTLTAALAYHFQQLSSTGGAHRPGIVHRLDRDTSGVIVVAKTDQVHMALAEQFEQRTVEKQYFALVYGVPDRDRDVVEQPIGIHPHVRERMAIRRDHSTSREARTFYEVAERFAGYAALRLFPKTGRTHQIRVHLTHVGYPVLCDRLYSGRSRITRGEIQGNDDGTPLLERQALHAHRIRLAHPITGAELCCEAPLPDDIQCVLDELRVHRARRV
jgi:23S rRNA pseudouridine1911/1915/1917 synthase